jgi:hypothetical protein
MEDNGLYILSAYLKKWSYGDNKLTVNYTFCMADSYHRKHRELRIAKSNLMVAELLGQLTKDASQINEIIDSSQPAEIKNETEVKKKLNNFFAKIIKEFKHNKKSHGKSRMISSRSIDFFYNDQDYEQLNDDVKFYVHLNRGLNKVSGDLWANAISDFKLAIKFKPDDITTNKHLAMAYNKLGQFSEAVKPLQIYADNENSAESLNALAIAYINLEEYKKADEIYLQITANFDHDLLALFGRSQIAYKRGNNYKKYLDEIFEDNPEWLVNKLKTEWEYNLNNEDLHTVWNAATAARYMGFERPFDLTKKAFNQEIPSYFDADKGTIRFVKEELDCWIDLHNRYNLDGQQYKIYEDRLSAEEKNSLRKKKKTEKSVS